MPYLALVPDTTTATAGDDARTARWWKWNDLPQPMAFDHAGILSAALQRAEAGADATAT